MAVFSIVHGNPFRTEMDEGPFYDAIRDLPSDVFAFAADTRLAMQTMTFGWGVDYAHWLTSTDMWASMGDADENIPMHAMLTLSMPLAFMPFMFVAVGPYFSPWTAVPAFVLDAYNIYRYFD